MDEKIRQELEEKLNDLIDEYGIDNILNLLSPLFMEKMLNHLNKEEMI